MKKALLLSGVLLGIRVSCIAQQAAAWPRNLKTSKVEFRGLLPWPPQVRTDEQQQAQARQWYKKCLARWWMGETSEGVPYNQSAPTYAGLPDKGFLQTMDRRDTAVVMVLFTVQLAASKQGLTDHVFNFHYRYLGAKSHWQLQEFPLEQVLLARTSLASKPALAWAQHSLTVALASW